MKNALFALTVILGSTTAGAAFADYSLVCGKGREQGPEKAELALVQDPASLVMKLYVDGEALAKERFIANGAPDNKWNVTVYDGNGDPKVRYEFREKPAEVQAFKPGPLLEKIGKPKACILKDTDAIPMPSNEGKAGPLKTNGKKYSSR